MVTTTSKQKQSKSAGAQTCGEWGDSMTYAQRQRLRFFEARLLWEGRINRGDVCEQFGISRNHFTRDIRAYKNHYPKNIRYDEVTRTYQPNNDFKAYFAKGSAEEYLALLRLHTESSELDLRGELGSEVPCAVIGSPDVEIDREVLREVLLAIHGELGCDVRYQSLSSPEPSERTIWPHALFFAGDVWYIRTYDNHYVKYLDLVLSRVLSARSVDKRRPASAGTDDDWIQRETLQIIPNPELSVSQQQVIAKQYGMKKKRMGFVWEVEMKRCLIKYFLDRYRLDDLDQKRKKARSGVPVQRIVLRNEKVIEEYGLPPDDAVGVI